MPLVTPQGYEQHIFTAPNLNTSFEKNPIGNLIKLVLLS